MLISVIEKKNYRENNVKGKKEKIPKTCSKNRYNNFEFSQFLQNILSRVVFFL